MQFAYQFPERTERMILVAPGGLGPEVTPFIRAMTLPGFHQVMGVATLPGIRHVGKAGLRALSRVGAERRARPRRGRRDLRVVQGPARPCGDPPRGPRRGRHEGPDRHHGRPGLPHPGDADARGLGRATTSVIPAKHAENAARIAPGAVVEVLPNSGHFPHKDHPDRFVKIVQELRQGDPAGVVPPRALAPAAPQRPRRAGQPRRGRRGPARPGGAAAAAAAPEVSEPRCRLLDDRTARRPDPLLLGRERARRGDDDDQAEHDQDRAEALEQRVEVLDRGPRRHQADDPEHDRDAPRRSAVAQAGSVRRRRLPA